MADAGKEKTEFVNSGELGVKEISAILEMLRLNDVTEFRLERGGERLWLKRGSAAEHTQAAAVPQYVVPAPAALTSQVVAATPAAAPAPAPAAVAAQPPAAAPAPAAPAAEEKLNLSEVKSPMVGTFYRRPAVDANPYVEVGDAVKKGDVLCIIEAMKLMNEIESEISGKIAEVCLEDGQMAEYGEVLFRIEAAR